jgi:hypothetical protein
VALVVLVLWIATASAGVALLGAGGKARELAAESARAAAAAPAAVRIGAIPLTAEGKPPPVPRTRVAAAPGEHPLLEFAHPALAVAGLACWIMFVFVHYRPMAWISLGILVVTLSAGLAWFARNLRAAARHAGAAWAFPPRLILAHGLAAAVAITLTILTALTAGRG